MADTGAVGFQGVQGPATTPTAKPTRQPKPVKGPAPFQGPIGLSDVIDQSPADGFAIPPNIYTHPNGHNVIDPHSLDQNLVRPTGTTAPISAAPSALNTGFAPMDSQFATPFNQQGIKPPKGTAPFNSQFGVTQEQIQSMQATQRAMQIVKISPNLARHPDIVVALAFNTQIPFTPETIKLVGAITKARSAINYAKDFTMADFNRTAHIVDPQAFTKNGFWDRLGRGLSIEGNWANQEAIQPLARGLDNGIRNLFGGQQVNYAPVPGGGATLPPILAGATGVKPLTEKLTEVATGITRSGEAFTKPTDVPIAPGINLPSGGGSGGVVASLPPISPLAKPIVQFAADQFDTPEHMYRYIASVQHKYGYGYAALALAPMVLGAAAGTALGGFGAKGAEISGAAEEALVNLVAEGSFSDLAASGLTGQALADAEAMQAAVIKTETARIAAAKGTAQGAERIIGPLAKIVTAVPRAVSKVSTSPTALGADIGFTGGGQGLFRQEYMDSRDGTVWAKNNPTLASTLGRWATEWMPEGGWKTGLSGAIDAAAMVAIPDALGAIGRMKGIARSAEGFRGGLLSGKYTEEETAAKLQARIDAYQAKLNAAIANGTLQQFLADQLKIKGKLQATANWFGKIYDKNAGRVGNVYDKLGGVYRTGSAITNIDRAYNELEGVRSTINLIAQVGSADAVIAIDARFAAYADLLAKARVLNADGTVNMTDSVENVKQVFRDSQTAEALLDPSRQMPIGYIPYNGGTAKRAIGATIKVIDKKGFTKELPLYTDLKDLRMENRQFSPGDRNSLPAISSWLTFAYGRGVAEQVVNKLAETTSPQVWENVLINTMTEANYKILVEKLVASDLDQLVIDEVLKGFRQVISNHLRQIFNFGGPGAKGHYGTGVTSVDATNIFGGKVAGGYVSTDLSRVQSHIEEISDDLLNKAGGGTGAAGTTATAPMMADDYSSQFFADAMKEHEDNLLAADADEAARLQRIAEGKATELDKRIQHEADLRARSLAERNTKGAWRGITSRVIEEELRRGGIKEGEVAAITAFINQIGEIFFKDLSLRISMKDADKLGHYEFANKLIQIYKQGVIHPEGIKRTLIHEMFHSLSNYLPDRFLEGLDRELQAARSDWIRQGNLERIVEQGRKSGFYTMSLKGLNSRDIKLIRKFQYAKDLLDQYGKESRLMEYGVGLGRTTGHISPEVIDWERLPMSAAEYRLSNLDEWFAESMYDRAATKMAQPMLVSDASLLKELGHRIVNALFSAINKLFGYKAGEVAFRNFWTKRFDPERVSEMALQDRLAAKRTGVNPMVRRNVMNLGPNHPLNGANTPFTNIAEEDGSTMAAGIVPSDTAKMMLPSYQQMDRIHEGLVDIMRQRFKDTIDTGPKIAKLEKELLQLDEDLKNAATPQLAAKYQKQIAAKEADLNIQHQIAALPTDAKALDYTWLQKTAAKYGPSALHDTINHYYNDLWFKQLALLTGGWATRTGMSEAALNIMRQGPLNYSAARLAASVARQERAVLHIGQKFTREAAQDIAARIYHVLRQDGMLDPNGKVFGSEDEMYAAVANIRRVGNEIFANMDLTREEILKAIQTEERNMTGATVDKAVARYRGAIIGAKRAAIKGLGKDELLDAAIKLMYLNNGHIVSPMLNATHAGVAQDMQAGSTTAEEIDSATYQRPLVGRNRGLQEAHHSRVYHSVLGTRARFAGDLFYRSKRMVSDEIYAETVKFYKEAYDSAKARLIADGHTDEKAISQAAADMASRAIHLRVQKTLAEMTPEMREALIRTRRPLEELNPHAARYNPAFYENQDPENGAFLLDPETEASVDHATAVIKSAEGTFRFLDGTINEKLLNAIAAESIPEDLGRFKKLFMTDAEGKEIPANKFNSVPGPELDHAKYSIVEKALNNVVGRPSRFIHTKALGPIVNRLTRDPIYIVDFAAERRLLEPMVKDGKLTRDQADVLAQSRASVNTMRYIHNPKNKLKFENMMRLWAPFYFAENQAWRRLGRLALTNPGAAEQYVKSMYAAQDAIYQQDQKTGNMSVPLPGSAWINKYVLGPIVTGAQYATTGRLGFNLGSDQGLEFNPSSLRTVFPWASEGGAAPGIGSLLNSFIPKGGPVLSIPAGLYVQHAAGALPFVDEFLAKNVIGDAGLAQSMLLSTIAPNAIMANAFKIFIGAFGAGSESNANDLNTGMMSRVTSSYVAAENMAIVSVLDNEQQHALEEAKRETAEALKHYKPGNWAEDKNRTSFQFFMDFGGTPAGWATFLMTEKMNDLLDPTTGKYQEFRDKVNAQTTALMNEKMVLAGISPFSIQVGRAHPELNKEWQDLVTKEGSVIDALPKWYKKYPWATAETLYTTQATSGTKGGAGSALGVSYPTQPGDAKWLLDHSKDIQNYSSAMRWVIPPELEAPKDGKGGYDQLAHMLQISWGLRAQKAPAGMIKTYQDSLFNQFVYGVLQPWGQKLIKNGWSVTDVNNILLHNKQTWRNGNKPKAEYSLLEQFGSTLAPAAFDDYLASEGANNRRDAMDQLIKATENPELLKKYPNFKLIKEELLPFAENLKAVQANVPPNALWPGTDKPYRDGLAEYWQGKMDELSVQYPTLKPVITQLFRPLAPVFTNG